MAQDNKDSKWEGKSTVDLKNIKAAQLWPFFEDFCGFHKWLPGLDSEKCHYIEGDFGEPGLVRHCAFTKQEPSAASSNGTDAVPTMWCNEKLLSMDPVQRALSYEMTENNLGSKSYVGKMKVIETDDGCKIEWSFVADPFEGMSLEDLKGFIESNLNALAEGMRKELQDHPAN